LARKRKKPVAVYFSPSSDSFQPVPEVLDLLYRILGYLFEMRIGVAFLTKGYIPEQHMKLLQANASLVRAQVGLTTLDDELARTFEPRAAAPAARLEQVKELVNSGIATEVRMDPVLPGLTDDADTLNGVCSACAAAGVKRIAVSTLFLRRAVIGSLKWHLKDKAMLDELLSGFREADPLRIHAERSSVIALPAHMRLSIHERVREIAWKCGLSVRVCTCKNPDIATGSCNIAGDWPKSPSRLNQHGLFNDDEGK
jgi:DNA repair photolyase